MEWVPSATGLPQAGAPVQSAPRSRDTDTVTQSTDGFDQKVASHTEPSGRTTTSASLLPWAASTSPRKVQRMPLAPPRQTRFAAPSVPLFEGAATYTVPSGAAAMEGSPLPG